MDFIEVGSFSANVSCRRPTDALQHWVQRYTMVETASLVIQMY